MMVKVLYRTPGWSPFKSDTGLADCPKCGQPIEYGFTRGHWHLSKSWEFVWLRYWILHTDQAEFTVRARKMGPVVHYSLDVFESRNVGMI